MFNNYDYYSYKHFLIESRGENCKKMEYFVAFIEKAGIIWYRSCAPKENGLRAFLEAAVVATYGGSVFLETFDFFRIVYKFFVNS